LSQRDEDSPTAGGTRPQKRELQEATVRGGEKGIEDSREEIGKGVQAGTELADGQQWLREKCMTRLKVW